MNIPNTNPAPNTGTAPAAKAPITPKTGAVLAERKVQAAKKSVMTVDARLYGVKPMALSKYINDMIKVTPFSGVTYNKTMHTIAKQNTVELKQARQGIDQIHTALMKFNIDFFHAHEENIRHLKELRELPKKPSVTSDRLTEIVKIEKDNRRDTVRRERGAQSQTATNEGLNETNATLKKILDEGKKESKDAKKSGGGLMGFLKHPIKFIWDMLGSVPGGRLIGGIGAAAGLGALLMHILPNTMKALYHMIVPQQVQDFFTGVKEFFTIVKTMATGFFKDPLGFIGKRIAALGKLLYDMFQDQFIAPIVYNVKVAMANISAFARHPVSAKNRKAELDKLMKDIGDKPLETKRDIGGSLIDILVEGEVGDDRVTKRRKSVGASRSFGEPKKPKKKKTKAQDYLDYTPIGELPVNPAGKSLNPKTVDTVINRLAKYDDLINAAAKKRNIDPNFLKAILAQESGGNPIAQSFKYDPNTGEYILDAKGNRIPVARGIAQFTEKTARYYGLRVDEEVDERLDPAKAIDASARYLEHLLGKTGNEVAAAGAYNAGLEGFRGMSKRGRYAKETKNYMQNIPVWKTQIAAAAKSSSSEVNAINQTKEEMDRYYKAQIDFTKKYYSDALNLQQQTVTGVNKLVNKDPVVSQTVNAPQLGAVTR